MWWDQIGILWAVKTVWNNHRRSISKAINAFKPNIEKQTAAIQRDKVILQHGNAGPHVAKSIKIYLEFEMGSPIPPVCVVFSRHCSLWLSFISINGTRPGWSALTFLWRNQKLCRYMHRFKRWAVLSTQDSYAARRIEESSGHRWTIFWIVNVKPVFYNKASNIEENGESKIIQLIHSIIPILCSLSFISCYLSYIFDIIIMTYFLFPIVCLFFSFPLYFFFSSLVCIVSVLYSISYHLTFISDSLSIHYLLLFAYYTPFRIFF